MAGILSSLGRSGGKRDPMRESAALTTVYLLEQNQKFERFMQQRVDELESRVVAQQARLSTRAEAAERELWAALEAVEDPDDAPAQAAPVVDGDPGFEAPFDIGDERSAWTEALPAPTAGEEASELPIGTKVEAMPDYLTLLGGAVTPSEDDNRIDIFEAVTRGTAEPEGEIIPAASPDEANGHPATNQMAGEAPPDDSDAVSGVAGENETVPADRAGPSPEAEGIMAWPGNRLTIAEANEPLNDVSMGEGNSASSAQDFTEASEEAVEIVPWVEAFSGSPPDSDEADEIWPEMEGDKVELLAWHLAGADDEPLSSVPGALDHSEMLASEGLEAEAEDEDTWEAALPEGQKDDWT
jgi:hypothetical protein